MTFPTSPAPSGIRIRSISPTRVSVAHSLKRQRRGGTAQAWGFTLLWSKAPRSLFAKIFAAAVALRGQYLSTTVVPIIVGTRQVAGSGTPVVKTATSTGRSVPVKGMAAGAVLGTAGDFLKFANHSKVYMLTSDATADGSGDVTISIEPGLYAAVVIDEALTIDNVPFTVLATSDVRETDMGDGGVFDFELDVIEDV